ncbi:MAG: hypothetical protein OEZ06_11955 [Myxococcales bacterium]|nr:hypothetical protein [Myxococcales bacterium]
MDVRDGCDLQSRGVHALVLALSLLVAMGCSEELQGPKPTIEAPAAEAEPPPVDPEIICRDQLTSTVTLHGDAFSPVPIDVPNHPKVALPDVILTRSHDLSGAEVAAPDRVAYSGDPDADPTNAFGSGDEPLLAWASQQRMSFVVNQELTLGGLLEDVPEGSTRDSGVLEEGVWDVTVANANGNNIESPRSLAVIGRPEISALTPGVVCLDQGERTITLGGTRYLRNEGERVQLQVEGIDAPFAVDLVADSCTAVAHDGLDAEVCDRATIALAQGSVDNGFPGIVLQNPETAACKSEEAINLRVVPPPSIDRVEPPLGCVTEEERSFVIVGSDFLRIDGAAPQVSVGGMDFAVDTMDGCEALETQGHAVEKCSSLTITVPAGALAPELYDVTVMNPEPAGCDNTASGSLRIVPPPTIDDVQPPLVCVDDASRDVVVTGTDFLVVAGEVPVVRLDGEALAADAIEPGGCEDLEVDQLSVQTCTSLTLTIPVGGVGVGMPTVEVENPQPAGCSDSRNDLLTVVEGPVIEAVDPLLVCTEDGSKMLAITGTGFLKVGEELPAVSVDGSAVTSVDSIADCAAVTVNGLGVERCTTLNVTVAMGALSEGRPVVEVANPNPAGCTASNAEVLTVPPPLAIASVSPASLCRGITGDQPITIAGGGFLRVGGTDSSLSFDGTAITPTNVADCTELATASAEVIQSCNTIEATLVLDASHTADVGTMLDLTVANDQVLSCSLSDTYVLTVVDPPTITGVDIPGTVEDTQVCADTTLTLEIAGTGYVEGTTVELRNDTGTQAADSVTIGSDTMLTATWNGGIAYDAADPTFDLYVLAGGGCDSDPVINAIEVNPEPLVFFVDPPVVFNGIAVDVTVFTSGLNANSSLSSIELIDGSGVTTELSVVATPRSNRIVANIAGIDGGTSQPTFAAGDYTVKVSSTIGCVGELPGGVTLTATLNDALLSSVDPNYVSSTTATAVTVTGSGLSGSPRLYLSPTGDNGTATALRAVEVQDASLLTAVVPSGVAAGSYDLILVSEAGEVDVLAAAVVVTATEPPEIESVVPASIVNNAATNVTLQGSGFDVDTVVLDCRQPDSSQIMVAGTIQGSPTATEVVVNFDAGAAGADAGSVCLVVLSNTDGSSFGYSALSLTNSSLNLSSWVDATNMNDGRRALALEAGRPTNTSRYLYAIGGDAGMAGDEQAIGTLYESVESASVDVFGTMSSWSYQRNDLSAAVVAGSVAAAPRTQAGSARIGRFFYLTGGYDGSSAVGTVLRAEVLDPLAVPDVEDLDAHLGNGSVGLSGGLYHYRVAAIFPSDDNNNPGGESLAGELLPVQLPDRSEKIVLTLTWSEIPGAHGYRIYRSPVADAGPDSVQLLAETSCGVDSTGVCNCSASAEQCQLEDDGSLTTTGGETPMPRGSLGVWHAVDGSRCGDVDCELNTARESHAAVAVEDPAMPGTFYLYAFGGRDGGGGYLDSYEVATVVVDSGGDHMVGDFTETPGLAAPRAELGAYVFTDANAVQVQSSEVWVYIAGGRDSGGFSNFVEANAVGAGGSLEPLTLLDAADRHGNLAGYGYGQANNQLFAFGGGGGSASGGGVSAEVCDTASCLPDLQPGAWNSLGPGNNSAVRIYMGSAQESAFFFLAGGHDGSSALATTEQTVQ